MVLLSSPYQPTGLPIDLAGLGTYFAQPYSPTAVAVIGTVLDPAHPQQIPCSTVIGFAAG
ncbi:hypothetical protein NBRGN_110_02440 [Nocardia brasiliensis NBRC 14402]|uniref:hypothetical protein n=1 Tax=Nocardia brasiliensis TaxID=37326 RepID=UPI0002F85A00|nr:hypothetical protein [Nocardia brasiliensis]ASF09479.1 hypothetical protein CEQ30_21290 [Nocardia brasiliensis]GAJ86579.1 hypothetical protein NBRGN_110_02440 [Nocardia brasiliensis NBRC 14402]SUB39808.1 Uncharacterised protein [Nocardia brasiliensis]